MAIHSKDKLIELLKTEKVIPFIGAGFSNSVANVPGWKSLIENGLKYALERDIDLDDLIPKAEKELKNNNFLEASEYLKELLNAPNYPFVNWIKDEFDNLTILFPELIDSVLDLNQQIIATTNYDTLLSSYNNIAKRQRFIHSEYEDALNLIKKGKEVILHLHGVYEKPNSIILSKSDYDSLNNNLGYKYFLKQLFSDYHILFIGCSRDGVMDEDFITVFNFIKEWFVNSSNQHFILLHEKEVKNKNHIRLLTECNVEAIIYGDDYSSLSPFINSINPNYKKKEEQLIKFKGLLKNELKRIAVISDEIKTNTDRLDLFLSDNLSSKYDWVDSERMKILEKLLDEFNESIFNKKEKLIFTQTIIRSVFGIAELKEKIDLWTKYGDTPEKLNPLDYISSAILAYNCLLKIPKELIEDIKFSEHSVLHPYFYDDYLGQFIREIQFLKQQKINLEQFYNDDKYLFENLKRIIDSLRSFLELNPDKLYEKIEKATISKTLPDSFITVVTNREITIRNEENLSIIYARLPLEKSFSVHKIEVIKLNDKYYIVGFNSKYCFYWQPQEDIFAKPFYYSENQSGISDIYCEQNSSSIVVKIKVGKKILEFVNFEESKILDLDESYYKLIQFNDGYIASKNVFSNYKGFFLFKIDSVGNPTQLLSLEELLSEVKKDKAISKLLVAKDNFLEGVFNLIDNIEIKRVLFKDQELILLSTRLLFKKKSSLLILIEISADNKIKYRNILHLKHTICSCTDYLVDDNNLELVCGYLDINRDENVCEYIKLNHFNVENFKTIQIERENDDVRDILSITYINKNHIVLNEERNKLISFSLEDNTSNIYQFVDEERVNFVHYFK